MRFTFRIEFLDMSRLYGLFVRVRTYTKLPQRRCRRLVVLKHCFRRHAPDYIIRGQALAGTIFRRSSVCKFAAMAHIVSAIFGLFSPNQALSISK